MMHFRRKTEHAIDRFTVNPGDTLELRTRSPGFFGHERTVAHMKIERAAEFNTAVTFELEDGSVGGYFTWQDR